MCKWVWHAQQQQQRQKPNITYLYVYAPFPPFPSCFIPFRVFSFRLFFFLFLLYVWSVPSNTFYRKPQGKFALMVLLVRRRCRQPVALAKNPKLWYFSTQKHTAFANRDKKIFSRSYASSWQYLRLHSVPGNVFPVHSISSAHQSNILSGVNVLSFLHTFAFCKDEIGSFGCYLFAE